MIALFGVQTNISHYLLKICTSCTDYCTFMRLIKMYFWSIKSHTSLSLFGKESGLEIENISFCVQWKKENVIKMTWGFIKDFKGSSTLFGSGLDFTTSCCDFSSSPTIPCLAISKPTQPGLGINFTPQKEKKSQSLAKGWYRIHARRGAAPIINLRPTCEKS